MSSSYFPFSSVSRPPGMFIVFICFIHLPSGTVTSNIQNACNDNVVGNGMPFPAVFWEHKPYIFEKEGTSGKINGALFEILQRVLEACCKKGTKVSPVKMIHHPTCLVNLINNQSHDIILPVGRRLARSESIFLRPFLGLIDSPGMAVVVKRSISGSELLAAILDSWPIMVFIAMCLSLSGIVIWVLDYRSNPDEFPEFFLRGIFEGFWWAAVTMTTVGYGDKVPRSIMGRLFAVVWINVGLVILAIFMGIITTSLTNSNVEQINNLYGMQVSVLNDSAEQQLAILQHAQLTVKPNYNEVYKSVGSGESQAAIVDIYSATQHAEFYDRYTLHLATVLDEPVVYGAVLPIGTEAARECFLYYRDNHQVEIHETVEKFIKTQKVDNAESGSGTKYFEGSIFGYSVYAMIALFAVALVFGLFWQYYYLPGREKNCLDATEHAAQGSKLGTTPTQTTEPGEDPIKRDSGQELTVLQRGEVTERLMAVQGAEILALENELKKFRKKWEKNFRALQERHQKEKERLLKFDNFAYEI